MSTEQDYGGDIADVVEKIRQQELADQQAATDKSKSEQTATTPTESTEGTKEVKTEGEGGAAAEAPVDKQGDPRAALRHARRSERQAREEAARLRAELEEARKQIPAPKDDGVTDAELAELEADMPLVAKALKETRALKAALPKAAAPAPAPADPDFIPPAQQPHVQDVIDDIPDLLSMQNDPDQSAFNLAIQTDALLKAHPKWADKPLAERLAECARRVKAELGAAAPAPQPPAPAPAPATTRRDPAAAVAKAEKVPPSTLSDIAGGAAPTTDIPGLKQFMNMSDEDIKEQLRIHG